MTNWEDAADEDGAPNIPVGTRGDDSGGRYVEKIDAGLARVLPDQAGLKESTYRDCRRRSQIDRRMCERRGVAVAAEGALTLFATLTDEAWTACEELDISEAEGKKGFEKITECLDVYFKYEATYEIPGQLDCFFLDFYREKKENMNTYIARHRSAIIKLRENGLDMPDPTMAWRLLDRSCVPEWQLPTIRSACSGKLTVADVNTQLKLMFGPDRVPHSKDIDRVKARLRHQSRREHVNWCDEETWENWEEEAYVGYDEDYGYGEYDDGYEEEYEEDDVPPELEDMYDKCEEALVAYQDSRNQMNEFAKPRGFFPVVALKDGGGYYPIQARDTSKGGKSSYSGIVKGSGKGSSKGKGKGNGKSKGRGIHGRYSGGTRAPYTPSPKSTATGSTQQRGPRFKRTRRGDGVPRSTG